MLSRVLEPEVMDSPTEALDYDTMDHAEVNRRFVDDLLAAWAVSEDGSVASEVLDLGTGTAQIPIELCHRIGGISVLAVDAASSMLEVARRNTAAAGLADRITLAAADAKRLPYESERFTAVISNSMIHHIPEPRHVLAEARRVTRPGGLLFFRDLMRPADEPTLRHMVDTYAAGANDHQRQMFGDSLHAALSLDEIRALVVELGFSPGCVQATSDRHWTWCATTAESVT